MKERGVIFTEHSICAILRGDKLQTRRIIDMATLRVRLPAEVTSDPILALADINVRAKAGTYLASMNPYGAVTLREPGVSVKPGEFDFVCPFAPESKTTLEERGDGRKVWTIRPTTPTRLWARERWAVGQCANGLKPKELDPGTWLRDNGGLWYEAGATMPKTPISPRGKTRPARHMVRWMSRLLLEVADVRVERLQDITDADIRAEGVTPESVRALTGRRSDYLEDIRAANLWRIGWDAINGKRAPWASNPFVWALTFRRVE